MASVTLGQWQVKPGGGPAVTSQDPPLAQGWLWQRSISISHRWPVAGVRLEVTPGFSGCLLTVGSAHDIRGQEDAGERCGGGGREERLPFGKGPSGWSWSSMGPRDPRPYLCARADTGSRRRWPKSGKPRCLRGGRAGRDTRPRPPHSAAPRSPEGRHSGSLQAWGYRFRGCGRAGTDTHHVLLSSSVLRSLGHTGDTEGASGGAQGGVPASHLDG